MAKSVLISGASIAGPALAWWLARSGFTPVLVERAPGPAIGGHAIDVRGAALKVLRAMGLAEAAERQRTRMQGVSILGPDGGEIWRSEAMTISGGTFGTEDIELLRDDLSNILVQALPENVEIHYGDSITALAEDATGITASFQKSPPRRFDLVIGADGLSSNIRNLVFGEARQFLHPMGVALAPFSAPNTIGLRDWQISYRDGNRSCIVYTARENQELRVCLGFPAGLDDAVPGRAAQMALLRERCGQMGWEVPGFLEALEAAPDFYLGIIAQVKMPQIFKGRVALVGDAGYSPSPFTGQGTSLALVGAYVLARELAATPDDHSGAFARYAEKIRHFVAVNHEIADLTRDPRFNNAPEYYLDVIEPAINAAKNAITLEGL